MDTWMIVVIVVAVIVVVAIAAWAMTQRRRRAALQGRFGDEYDRTLEQHGDRRAAERALEERVERREQLHIRPLDDETRNRYAEQWRQIQARFVDTPGEAVLSADLLVSEVMRERGYPVEDFDQQADLVSVDHPDVVNNYRHGHEIFVRHRAGEAKTEDLREAMLSYRSLFDELLRDERVRERA